MGHGAINKVAPSSTMSWQRCTMRSMPSRAVPPDPAMSTSCMRGVRYVLSSQPQPSSYIPRLHSPWPMVVTLRLAIANDDRVQLLHCWKHVEGFGNQRKKDHAADCDTWGSLLSRVESISTTKSARSPNFPSTFKPLKVDDARERWHAIELPASCEASASRPCLLLAAAWCCNKGVRTCPCAWG